jgi:hypothetical protein
MDQAELERAAAPPCSDCKAKLYGVCRQVKRARQRAVAHGYEGSHFPGSEWLALLEASGA